MDGTSQPWFDVATRHGTELAPATFLPQELCSLELYTANSDVHTFMGRDECTPASNANDVGRM